jgi:hypothetical protein
MARGHADGVPIARRLPGSDSIKVKPANGNPCIFSHRKSAAGMHSTGSVEQQMKTEHTRKATVDLYWLAFLLTGSRDISIDIAADAAVSEDDTNPFFTDWIHGWQRRLVIAKGLDCNPQRARRFGAPNRDRASHSVGNAEQLVS